MTADQLFHTLPDLVLDSGQRLDCRVGYRTYGTRTEDLSTVIVFPTWFGGTTADLERYDKVGPGALADSDAYFVVTIDALGNGVSCSPSNSALPGSDVGRVLTTADMVRSQYRLLKEGLGIDNVHAVLGVSMGGMQALRWLELYPDFADKFVVIDGSPRMTSYDLLHWTVHRDVVTSLKRAGASDRTIGGVVARLTHLTLFTPDYFVNEVPTEALGGLLATAAATEAAFRADDYVSQLDAMLTHDVLSGDFAVAARQSGAEVLTVSTPADAMVNQRPIQSLAARIGSETLVVISECGHLGSTCESEAVNARVASFLEKRARR